MLPQQRSGVLNSQKGKVSAPASLTSSAPTVILPPSITPDSLSSLVRLPLHGNSTVKWEKYSFKADEGKEKLNAAIEALLGLALAQNKAYSLVHRDHRSSMLSSHHRVLWALEDGLREERHTVEGAFSVIWVFELEEPADLAESSAEVSSEPRQYVDKCREVVKQSFVGITKGSGQCLLKEIYPCSTTSRSDDPSSLIPSTRLVRMYRCLIEALEESFLSMWGWSNSRGAFGPGGKKKKKRTREKAAPAEQKEEKSRSRQEEEEEGAIADSSEASASNTLAHWPSYRGRRGCNITRFGKGVIIHSPASGSTFFDPDDRNDRLVQAYGLRCFADDRGHMYLEARPQAAGELKQIRLDEVENEKALLGPMKFEATLLKRVDVSQAQFDKTVDSDMKRDLLYCQEEFLKRLERRGVHLEALHDEWILCETQEKAQFLWPAKLCYLQSKQAVDSPPTVTSQSLMRYASRPLRDVACRAKGLVREAVGLRGSVEDEGALILDFDGEQERENEPMAVEEEDVEEEDEDKDGDFEEKDAEGMETCAVDVPDKATLMQSQASKEVRSEVLASISVPATILARNAGKENGTVKDEENDDDDETDLWGSFGFGRQDEEDGKDMRRQSVVGIDEGTFGLITEDDFSFFDETAREAFIDLDEKDEKDSLGNATAREKMDIDYPSDAVTTSATTFVDPPSLPGFTPGSLSATSPAMGLNAKTPITPYSPSQDIVDATVAIEGETESLFHHPHRFQHLHSNSADIALSSVKSDTKHDDRSKDSVPDIPPWSRRNRGDLTSKYEQGKFALPLVPSKKKRGREEGSAEGMAAGGGDEGESGASAHPRSRLHHRRRFSDGKTHQLQTSLLRKLQSGAFTLPNDEEMSEVDASLDGTISECSSLVAEESDGEDNDSSTNGDAGEADEVILKEKIHWMRHSTEYLMSRKQEKVEEQEGKKKSADEVLHYGKDADIKGLLELIVYNPEARKLICPPNRCLRKSIPRTSAIELLTFASADLRQLRLATLLDLSASAPLLEGNADKAIQVLESPRIMVGCQESVATMESTALLYWDKLGLSSVSGPKEIVALAIYCENLPDSWQGELLTWIATFNCSFKKTNLGSQELARDGLLALGSSRTLSIAQVLSTMAQHSEQWNDTLESILSRIEGDLKANRFIVIYAFETHFQSSSIWPFFRLESDLRTLAKNRWSIAAELINVREFPWTTISSSMSAVQSSSSLEMRRLAVSIYDSLLVPVSPHYNHKAHLPSVHADTTGLVHPSFTLSPSSQLGPSPGARFRLKWKTEPFNLIDTGLLLHVGYHVGAKEGEVSFVAMMDERAQGHFFTGWRRMSTLEEEIELIWQQVQAYARRARVIWRIIICSDRQLPMEDVKCWSGLLKQQVASLRALDVTLACLDTFTPMALVLAPRSSGAGETTTSKANMISRQAQIGDSRQKCYIDARQVNFAIYPPFRLTMCRDEDQQGDDMILALQSSVTILLSNRYDGSVAATSLDDQRSSSTTFSTPQHYWLHILQVYESPMYNSYQDDISMHDRIELITQSFHQLRYIARERFFLEDNLPWHISILLSFSTAFPSV
ncbi:hypothetical protein CBS101457_003880 [Exobasidium rhododendri]|nr:hypothetical protein CBS101457_003880 [Exobasidium rhododendri]